MKLKSQFRFILIIMAILVLKIAMTTTVDAWIKVGLVTDMGKIDDKTFNQHAYKGMIHAGKAFGFETAFIETQQPTDYLKNIEQFAKEGFTVILTVGYMLGDATRTMAEKYPNINFIIVDFAYDPPIDNVLGLIFSESQAGFMAGSLAGLMTKNKVIGMVAGKQIPPVVRFKNGYKSGVSHVCRDCEVLSVHIDSFNDPSRGKTAALSQMDEGADIIFGAGGTTGSGAIMGAAQAGAWVIGVDQDEYQTTFKGGKVSGANKVLSSALKRIDIAVYDSLKSVVDGTFQGGTRLFDTANDGVGLAPFHEAAPSVPEKVQTALETIKKQLASGIIDP